METLTWADFHRLGRGYQRRQENHWRHTRWLGACLYNAQRTDKDPVIQPEDLFPLASDRKAPAAAPPTAQELADTIAQYYTEADFS